MTDDQPTRRPFGDRSSDDPQPVFGARAPRRPRRPTDPYTDSDRRPVPRKVEEPEPFEEDDLLDEPVFTQDEEPVVEEPASVIDAVAERIPVRLRPEEPRATPPPPEPEPEPEPTRREPVTLQFGVIAQTIGAMVFSGIVVATMFTWWTPVDFLPAESVEQLSVAQATQASAAVAAPPIATLEQIAEPVTPTAPPPPPSLNNIGIVSGHRGIYPPSGLPDPGAVCPDGLTEREVNEAVATRVVDLLVGRGYAVDLLDEFDERLTGYQALALVSIHADTCEFVNELATGYKVASFSASRTPEADERLVRCLSQNYEDTTGLSFHPSITFDMTQYHNFREVNPSTPAAIIEIGFMYLDRELLTEQPDTIALGITRGILCFLDG